MPTVSTWVAVAAIAGNYGARSLTPILAHVFCAHGRCDAATLVGSTASAFFAGDFVAQAAAKALVQRFSGGALLVAGTASWGLLVLGIMPLVLPDPLLVLMPAQFVLGFCCGLGYPAAHAVLASTVPVAIRTTAVTLVTSAAALGTMASNFATPQAAELISASPYVFFACVGLLTSALALLCIPCGSQAGPQSGAEGGFGDTLREASIWVQDPLIAALFFGMWANGLANAFLYTFVPTLFVEVYEASVVELGWLTMAAPLGNALCCVLSGIASDYLIARQWPTYSCRILMQSIGTAVPAVSLLGLYLCTHKVNAALCLAVWFASHGFQTSGLTVALHDVAHARASEFFAVGNVFSKLAGICAGPLVVYISRRWGWSLVLGIIGAHYAASGACLATLLGRVDQSARHFEQAATRLARHGTTQGEEVPGPQGGEAAGPRPQRGRVAGLSITVPPDETLESHPMSVEGFFSRLADAAFGKDPGSPLSPVFHHSPLRAEGAQRLLSPTFGARRRRSSSGGLKAA
ncbi:unnamed protein product [Prorocentrum cordatum]|uniref:Major facilitator superfamily (MFS) profile domain-containing protein n=1 Tax=Prorocentrum cordatum TaxID=2364126 RepID=A0ABN9T9K5_9DINO|nr:unnamed protein product [Polarella glacialis]